MTRHFWKDSQLTDNNDSNGTGQWDLMKGGLFSVFQLSITSVYCNGIETPKEK